MNDLISREAAIAAADRADYPELAVEDVKAVTDEVVKELKKLPSVEQQRRWIPVAERLPEKEGMYLVTSFNGRPKLDVARFYIDEEGLGHFSCNWGAFDYVTAWMMPLPEPYKGGVQEWTMILPSGDEQDE